MSEKKVTKEHVDEAVANLREHGLLSDTSKNPDGTRSAQNWMNAMREDMGIIQLQLEETLREVTRDDKVRALAVARKETNRLLSDIFRFADEAHGIPREEIEEVWL